jgi:ADP-ribosylglycohydrolase
MQFKYPPYLQRHLHLHLCRWLQSLEHLSIFTQSASEASTSTDEDAVYTADEGSFIIFINAGTTNMAIMRIPPLVVLVKTNEPGSLSGAPI